VTALIFPRIVAESAVAGRLSTRVLKIESIGITMQPPIVLRETIPVVGAVYCAVRLLALSVGHVGTVTPLTLRVPALPVAVHQPEDALAVTVIVCPACAVGNAGVMVCATAHAENARNASNLFMA
jgi:hypothetical protein